MNADAQTSTAQAAGSTAQERAALHGLLDLEGVGVLLAEPDTGRWLRVNNRLAAMLQRPVAELEGRGVQDVAHPEDRARILACLKAVAAGRERDPCTEARLLRADGSVLWALLSVSLLRDSQGQPWRTLAFLLDLGERRLSEPSLAQDKERLELALGAAQLGLWEWSFDTGRLWYSEEVLHITGLTREQLDADPECWRLLVHPQDMAALRAADEAVCRGQGYHAEYRLLRADGQPCWVANDARFVCDDAGQPRRMVGTLADITARKQAEEALRQAHDELEQRVLERTAALELANTQLANEVAERRATNAQIRELLEQLVNAEEEERRRLARELHDSLGQHLTALTLGLRAVQEDPALPAALRARLGQLREVTRRLDDDVDRLSYQLRPALLDDLGLHEALRELAGTWAEDSGIAVDIHTRGLRGQRFDAALETTVYRVVQEALTNVRKHAQATRVGLIVELKDGELRAIVEDDGRGLQTEACRPRPGPGRHLGLRGMAERARQAGGRLDLETEAGQGTTVYLSVPLQPGGD